MTIEIDTDKLIRHKLSADDFLYLKLLKEKKYNLLDAYVKSVNKGESFRQRAKLLKEEGYIFEVGGGTTISDFKLTEKFLEVLGYEGEPFEELYEMYPVKVTRPNGNVDYLRQGKTNNEKLYNQILVLGGPKLHRTILECLKYELEERKKKGTMKFMRKMHNWLANAEWTEYGDKIKDIKKKANSEPKYGEEIV